MKMKFLKFVLPALLSFAFNSCLKDSINSPAEIKLNSNVELLSYLESTGDHINSENFPSLISAQEVFNNLNNYLIVDIRSKEDFYNGHINNSLNKSPDSLLIFLKSIQPEIYSKIVLVSGTGQSASYYCCLLNLYGFSNVYAMKYGMAAWNNDFSGPWLSELKDASDKFLTNNIYDKGTYTKLPSPIYPNQNADIKTKFEYRINKLISEGFDDDIKSSFNTPVTTFDKLLWENDSSSMYIICLGVREFYGTKLDIIKHPFFSVNYRYFPSYFEFESTHYLQTIPSNKSVYLYSYAGQVSAGITAYLRVLGYNAYSILFGGNNLIYSAMLQKNEIKQYAFSSSNINNFPYVTGN